MRRLAIAAALLVLGSIGGLAQSSGGAIAGFVTDPGGIVAGATVEAKAQSTGKVYTATSGKMGQYRIAGLPPGAYDISVPELGFRTQRYVKQNVAVDAAKTLSLDIVLRLGNQGVIGDDNGYLALHNKHGNVAGPAPRTADGRPDLSGVWNANVDPNPEPAALLPWAAAELDRRFANRLQDMPGSVCLPDDPAPTQPLLYRIVQTRSMIVQLFEQEPHYRQVFMDGRGHPKDLDPTWMGHSIGRWERDTLVVDTVGFNDKSWITQSFLPHTEMLHMIERYRRPDRGHLRLDLTLEDPGAFTRPVERHMTWELAPGEDILESICPENNKYRENAGIK